MFKKTNPVIERYAYDMVFTNVGGRYCNVSSTANGFIDSMCVVLFELTESIRQLLILGKVFHVVAGEWVRTPIVSINIGNTKLAILNRFAALS